VCSTKSSIQIIEKSLEYVKGPQQKELIDFLITVDSVVFMANNPSGLFIIQKCFNSMPRENMYLYQSKLVNSQDYIKQMKYGNKIMKYIMEVN